MRWRAFFFLQSDGTDQDTNAEPEDDEYYGFNSKKAPPQIEELKPFEDDLVRMIDSIEFRNISNPFQDTLRRDISRIKNSDRMFVRADKTRNIYEMTTDQYEKLLHENITKHYKAAPEEAYSNINNEAKTIAERLDLADRMESLARSEAFITLKDHKDNFENTLPCRLINPAKSEMGIVSKRILESIVERLRSVTKVNLWQNTTAVIDWFKAIKDKSAHSFISFDVVEFYPSISAELLTKVIDFARQYIEIKSTDAEIIFHARKSLLFERGKTWMKREKNSLFDVTMGSYDGAEVCELVGVFMLNNLKKLLETHCIGLYRDDGLGVLKDAPGHVADATRKSITSLFKQHGLRVTINANIKIANFLDTQFDLETGKYRPYRKPNDQPAYVNKHSNHPPKIIENIPAAIGKRISNISSDQGVFTEAATVYEQALSESGYQTRLVYEEGNRNTPRNRKQRRRRNVTWFNPPFSCNVSKNIGRRFLNLVDKHFPRSSKLRKIFNRGTLKVSYSCMPNVANIISGHNKRLRHPRRPISPCNCRQKDNCPLNGECQASEIVYKAEVKSQGSGALKEYIGLTELPFKLRYANHQTSFRHERYRNSTELSKHSWDLRHQNVEHSVSWSIIARVQAYNNERKRCDLCLMEKLQIISAPRETRLNKRPEIVSTCRHANKFKLSNFVPIT